MPAKLLEVVDTGLSRKFDGPRLRITLAISMLNAGGAQRVMSLIASHLVSHGHEVTLLTRSHPEDDWFEVDPGVTREHVDLGKFESVRWFDLRGQIRRVALWREAIRATNPDVILSFIHQQNIVTLLAARPLSVPVVISERASAKHDRLKTMWRVLRPITYRWANGLVVQTKEAANDFLPQLRNLITVIPNPVIEQHRSAYPASRGAGHKKVICLGRLDHQKRHDLLIRAFAAASSKVPGWKLTIYGDGPLKEQLADLCVMLEVTDRVVLPGATSDPFGCLAEAHLFAMSSAYEGFPNSLCEAMSIGLPVIATDCKHGPSEIIRHGIDGLLVPTNDIDALVGALETLMRDDKLRAQMGAEAQTIAQRFDANAIMNQWEDLLLEAALSGNPELAKVHA
jgi:glycosyltransferase involved in cell wall biosynthesis